MNHGNKFLKVVSSFCAASMIAAFLCTSQVSAATAVRKAGDVDGDGAVTSIDATLIQRYCVGMTQLDSAALLAADVDFDGDVSVCDATIILRHSANIDVITPLLDTKWTALGSSATSEGFTKTIRFKSALASSRVSVSKPSSASWLSYSLVKSGSNVTGVKLTVTKNTTQLAKNATVTIKVDGNAYKVSVKQMAAPKTDKNEDAGWAMCYHYALKWNADPRATTFTPFDYDNKTGDHADPGFISGKTQYKSYSSMPFNILADSNFYNNFKTDLMNRVKADLDTLGWGIKAKSSATASVKAGDWLVCLTFNPRETYSFASADGKMVCINKVSDGYVSDYHWYRRSGSSGSYTWSHKPGKSSVLTLASGKTPADYDATNNKYTYVTLNEYKNVMTDYAQQYAAFNAEHPKDSYTYKAATTEDLKAIKNAVKSYFIIGYYEVGPNAF